MDNVLPASTIFCSTLIFVIHGLKIITQLQKSYFTETILLVCLPHAIYLKPEKRSKNTSHTTTTTHADDIGHLVNVFW